MSNQEPSTTDLPEPPDTLHMPTPTRTLSPRTWLIIAFVGLIVVMAVAGWLVLRARAQATQVVQTAQAEDLQVTMQLDQAAIGQRELDLSITNTLGRPSDVNAVQLHVTMTDMDMGTTVFYAKKLDTGRFQASGQFFTMAGDWAINATLQRTGQPPIQIPFTFVVAAPNEESGPTNPFKNDSQAVANGQTLYAAYCVPCHGATGKGNGPSAVGMNPRPSDFTLHMGIGLHTDGQVFLWIKNGYPNSAMPAWGQQLNDEQIWQLVNFLRTFGQKNSTTDIPTPVPQAPLPNVSEPLPAIVFARESNIWRSAGDGSAAKPLTNLQNGTYAEYPIFSPDDRSIAFIVITPPSDIANGPLTPTSALYIMNADGSNQRAIWQAKEGMLSIPTWSADGKYLYVAANSVPIEQNDQNSSYNLQIVRVEVATGALQTVLGNSFDPAISRDGRAMVYLQLAEDGYTIELHIAAPDGSGARRLNDGKSFQSFYAPRLSPDGKQIIVAAVGGPETDAQGYPIQSRAPSLFGQLAALFDPPTAEAHGLPWDLWSINSDGTGLRRITNFYEDLPMSSFSPDGKQVVVMGFGGIYLMNPDGSNLRRIDRNGDHGGLDWAR